MTVLAAILLAAGRSTRFDASGLSLKLLQPAPGGAYRGMPIAVAAACGLRDARLATTAVVRSADTPAQRALHEALRHAGCELVINADADQGMGTSLALGVKTTCAASGWIVALADMPAIATGTINSVAAALNLGHSTVAPYFEAQRGHPVGFARSLFDELAALTGDLGAKHVLKRHPPHLIHVDDPGVLLDFDTPASLE